MPEQLAENPESFTLHHAVACPFCSLLCDDLVVAETRGALKIVDNGCPKSRAAYARPVPASAPLIDGKPASLEDALNVAARQLKRSRQPLFGGFGTDIDGARAALALAERCGAIVDHLHGRALAHNVRVLQSRGLATTTLSEVRNRADLVVLVGANINDDFHEFARRCLRPSAALVDERLAARRVFHLGPAREAPRQAGVGIESIACSADELVDLVNALRALRLQRQPRLRGKRLQAVRSLVDAIAASEYAVFVWAPGQLGEDGDLLVGAVCDLIADLNHTKRAAGLALGGNDGGQSAMAAAAWLTGYPLQLSYAGNTIEYDPLRYDTGRLLAAGAVDSLLWVSSFNPHPVPATSIPQIVIGMPAAQTTSKHGVFLPAGTPGLDHRGELIRTDGAVALPMPQLRNLGLPSAAFLLHAIAQRMV